MLKNEERVRALPLWKNEVTVTPLEGGITNRNYVVEDGHERFVARTCKELIHLGIERRNEVDCQRFAASLGIAPRVIHHEPGIIVSEFITGKTLTAEDVRVTAVLERVAATLRTLHDSVHDLQGVMLFFSPFQTVLTYAATAKQMGAELPADIEDLLEDSKKLANLMSPFTPTLCHNDLLPANFIDDAKALWLVDWEYSGVGNPLFDLAGVSANCAMSNDQERRLLECYRGRVVDRDLRELKILKAVSLLRESLWSVIQTAASDIDFDYHEYAATNLEAYRSARGSIEGLNP